MLASRTRSLDTLVPRSSREAAAESGAWCNVGIEAAICAKFMVTPCPTRTRYPETRPRDTPRHECAQATGDVPPTINYATPDPECDLDYVPNAARKVLKPRAAISDNLGFGGHNAAIVFKAYE